jgi:hypothetical protein
MIGPFKPALENFKCLFVMIDKFFKWIEYMPLTKASSEKAVEFLSQNVLNYDGPRVPIIVIMTSDSHTCAPHNLQGLFSSEQDPITGVS